jgi:hypothetical protein
MLTESDCPLVALHVQGSDASLLLILDPAAQSYRVKATLRRFGSIPGMDANQYSSQHSKPSGILMVQIKILLDGLECAMTGTCVTSFRSSIWSLLAG